LIKIPDNVDSKYRFVIVSALRARQIQGGSAPKVGDEAQKPTQIAKRELLEGLIQFTIPETEVVLKKE
jgi:DNA-directed RNA polymerase omega subunit